MTPLLDEFVARLRQHRCTWNFISSAKGTLYAFSYFDEQTKLEVNAIEFSDCGAASCFEHRFKYEGDGNPVLKTSVNDFLEDRKITLEEVWNSTTERKPKIETIPLKVWRKNHGQPLYKV